MNQFLQPKEFKLDHLNAIFPYLKKGWVAAKVDLKDAYFHLNLSSTLSQFVRVQVGVVEWEFLSACFGLSTLPQLFMQLMKVLEKIWRTKGIFVFVYLDDILVLAPSEKRMEKDLGLVVDTLLEAGFKINTKKSTLYPCTQVQHLGMLLDFAKGVVEVPPHKLKTIRKELGKLVTHQQLTCRKVASILGQVRSYLVALPFLRLVTDRLLQFSNLHRSHGWDHGVSISPEFRTQVQELETFLHPGFGRKFQTIPSRSLHSDSSQEGWGGLDPSSGAMVHDFWRQKRTLHINYKELEAAVATVKSLAQPGESIKLSVDNTVAYSYLKKWGGRVQGLNKVLKPLWHWCKEKDIDVCVEWVPSNEMKADAISRWVKDPEDCTLNPHIFNRMLQVLGSQIQPQVDMFASPGNAKLPLFCTRWPHYQAHLVDALRCPLGTLREVYGNPPWSIISQWLHRLKANPQVVCLLVVPYWVSATWWPLLIKLSKPKTKCILFPPQKGMFANCWGECLPKPKWPLACLIVSGSFWNNNRYKLRTSICTWQGSSP